MGTAILYSRWRYSQNLKEKNVELNILYVAELIFKWKGKKKIFQHKKLRLGNTKTAFGINIRVTLQKKGNKSKRKPQEGAWIHLIVRQYLEGKLIIPFHCAGVVLLAWAPSEPTAFSVNLLFRLQMQPLTIALLILTISIFYLNWAVALFYHFLNCLIPFLSVWQLTFKGITLQGQIQSLRSYPALIWS